MTSELRYVQGATAQEREENLWHHIRSLEAKLVIAEHEAREKITTRQQDAEDQRDKAIAIAEALLPHFEQGEYHTRLNNLKAQIK
jgi:hypothetical protein